MACGHAAGTPGDHFRVGFSCGHEDYYCYRGDHDGNGCTGYVHPDDRVSPDQKSGETLGACGHMYKPTPATIRVHRQIRCPSGPNGVSCTSGSYWVCQSHTHSYATADTDTDTDPPKPDPKLTRQACGHVYDPDSSSAHSHRSIDCPPQNGKDCSYGSYYACTPHTHAYTGNQKYGTFACGHTAAVTAGYYHRSVSCPDKNGVSCSYGSYYVCTPHTHSYPSRVVCPADSWTNCGGTVSHSTTCPAGHSYYSCNASAVSAHKGHKATTTNTGNNNNNNGGNSNNNNDDDDDDDDDPPQIVCPANRWTSCGGTVSHATTCGADHSYYTCNPSAVSSHSGYTSKPDPPQIVCPANRWTKCGGTSSHSTTCKAGHSYYSCNASAVNAHKWHVKAGVNCPAHAWTNCNGATSHAKTCGRGHKYYTCNASAVTAHKWH